MGKHESIITVYRDPLYGRMEFPTKYIPLLTVAEFRRLYDTNIALPAGIIFAGDGASRAVHCRGVGYLGSLVGQKACFALHRGEIITAGIYHDLGHGPFSHGSEEAMEEVLGVRHEERAWHMIESSEIRDVLNRLEVSLPDIKSLLSGKHPIYSTLCNGSIDLDCAENTLRCGVGLGLITPEQAGYSPKALVRSFCLHQGRLCLHVSASETLRAWQRCRDTVYSFIYQNAHLSAEAMLKRAISLAVREGCINSTFFDMTDGEAITHLSSKCGVPAEYLMDRLLHLEHYDLLLGFQANRVNTNELADYLAAQAGLANYEVSVGLRHFTHYKHLELPLVDDEGNFFDAPNEGQKRASEVKVFVSNRATKKQCGTMREAAQEYMQRRSLSA